MFNALYYRNVEGAWPFGARWEGVATIEEYSMAAQMAPQSRGLGLETSQGLVQLLQLGQDFRNANAVAVLSYQGSGSSPGENVSFDEAERWWAAEVRRNDGVMRSPTGFTSSISTSMSLSTSQGVQTAPGGAVRIGGSVRPPVKLVDVPPVRPEQAERANVRGIVIVEVTIDADRTVKDARVLRSIPMLDAAALEAVRQWRYEPTTVYGNAVPVIMTVTVSF